MVSELVKKSINALTSKQTSIFSAAFYITLTTVLAQILGILKYRMLVSVFGASNSLGVYFAAFRIPDFLLQVLINAALSSAFIPIFSEFLLKDKKEDAYKFTSAFTTLSITVYVVVALITSLFSFPLSSLVAPGFSGSETHLMSILMVIILFSQVFMILGTILTAVLQSFQHFLIPGIASALYNLGIIIGLVVFTPFFGIYGAAIGVLLGSILFLVIQVPLLKDARSLFRPYLVITKEVKKLITLSIPRALTLGVIGFSSIVSVFFASFLSPKSYVYFDLAQTLMLAPVVLFGQSIAQASFPALSQKVNQKHEFQSIFLSSFNQIVYLTLPISVLLIVLRIPLVRLFFGASGFDWVATVETGRTLSFFAVSIFAQSLAYLLARAFYAFKDTKTPFLITTMTTVLYIVLGYVFILKGGQPVFYLAFSFSVTSIISIILLMWLLDKKIDLPKFALLKDFIKISIATGIMGVSLYIPIKLLDQLVFDTTHTINLLILTGIASCLGFASFVLFTWLLDIREALVLIAVVKKFGKWNSMLKQIGELIEGPRLNP